MTRISAINLSLPRLVLVGLAGVLLSACGPRGFTNAVNSSSDATLYEGLPHQGFEAALLKSERESKATSVLHGFDFYDETLPLEPEDVARLKEILGDGSSFESHAKGKKCGAFHPDYALEWKTGGGYFALICFGCGEAKLFGPGFERYYDLSDEAKAGLRELLGDRVQNRPQR